MDKQFTNYFTLNDKPIELTLNTDLYEANYHAFRAHIPSLLPLLKPQKKMQLGMLQYPGTDDYDCLHYGSSQLTYTPNAAVVEQQKVIEYLANASPYPWQPSTSSSTLVPSISPAPGSINTSPKPLVIFGLGLGFHIEALIKSGQYSDIVMYEAQPEFLALSLYVIDWASLLAYCTEHTISLFLQIGHDGSEIFANLNELQDALGFTQIFIYKHFNTHVYDAIILALKEQGASGTESLALNHRLNQFVHPAPPLWQDSSSAQWQTIKSTDSALFQKNMEALAIHFPDLYSEFSAYQPQFWHPVVNADGIVNAGNLTSETLLYSRDIDACATKNLEVYLRHPTKETLSIGYRHFKHEHYIQHRFTKKVQDLFVAGTPSDTVAMPEHISCLLLFGCGLGHILPKIMHQREIDHLFLCESQLDFFYCSLFTLDWSQILQSCIDKDVTLYLNIGQDGEQLLDEITQQSQKIGVHIMATTYVYKPYYDPALAQLFTELREHLKAQLVMSENLDHVMYGLAHTEYSIAHQIQYLLKPQKTNLHNSVRDFPVFVIGNGPSLDDAIEHIKDNQAHVIIISCGTALKALIQHNIIPDYHAEIEQNRACFDWIAQSTTAQQRQQITLISCNGVHPDVIALFPETKLVAKAGETSTALFFGYAQSSPYAFVEHAFPTVSNFALNFVLEAGFKNMFLFGVDLGFKDKAHHHSKYSAYYQNAKDVSTFTQQDYGTHCLPGNFCQSVQTKYEFKIARRHMQACISHYKAEIFNLSDGARIEGTYPLRYDDLLVLPNDKVSIKAEFENTCFSAQHLQPRYENYLRLKSNPQVNEEINALRIHDRQLQSYSDVVALCSELRAVLFASLNDKQTITFYLFNSVVHTLCAIFMSNIETCRDPDKLALISHFWDECLDEILHHLNHGLDYDYSNADIYARSDAVLQQQSHTRRVTLINHDASLPLARLAEDCQALRDSCVELSIVANDATANLHCDSVQVHLALSLNDDNATEYLTRLKSLANTHPEARLFVITHAQDVNLSELPENICLVVIPRYVADNAKSEYTLAYTLHYLPHVVYNCAKMAVVMFKYYPCDDDAMALDHKILTQSSLSLYHTRLYITALRQSLNIDARVATNGCRLTPLMTECDLEVFHLGREINAPLSSKYQEVRAVENLACG